MFNYFTQYITMKLLAILLIKYGSKYLTNVSNPSSPISITGDKVEGAVERA